MVGTVRVGQGLRGPEQKHQLGRGTEQAPPVSPLVHTPVTSECSLVEDMGSVSG